MKTMKNILKIWMLIAVLGAFTGCTDEEAEVLQKPYERSEEYYANIRAFKESDHCRTFVYYAAWAPLEGIDGYKDPASYGERLIGLPDSLDIVNLWMSIPSNDPEDTRYAPVAYADMVYCQQKLGTRFVSHSDASHNQVFEYNGKYYNVLSGNGDGSSASSPIGGVAALEAYGQTILDDIYKYGLDGTDIDYEPNDQTWTGSVNGRNRFLILVEYLGQFIGPQGSDPSKLLIVDYFGSAPNSGVGPYLNYLVKQQYSDQLGTSESVLNSNYNSVSSWCPSEKYIICEQFGNSQMGPNGGQNFTYGGKTMISIEAYARWASTNNRGGFGAYYVDRNYYSNSGIPYYEFRRAIQIATHEDM